MRTHPGFSHTPSLVPSPDSGSRIPHSAGTPPGKGRGTRRRGEGHQERGGASGGEGHQEGRGGASGGEGHQERGGASGGEGHQEESGGAPGGEGKGNRMHAHTAHNLF